MSFSRASRIISTSSPYPMPVSSRFARNVPSISPTVGKFCTPENPIDFNVSRKWSKLQNGSVPLTPAITGVRRSEEHTSELQSRGHLVCRLLLENKKRLVNGHVLACRDALALLHDEHTIHPQERVSVRELLEALGNIERRRQPSGTCTDCFSMYL